MKLNLWPNVSATDKSVDKKPLSSNLPLKSQDLGTPSANGSTPGGKTQREFAWQVAPNLFVSFKYAWAGLNYAFKTQRNFRVHVTIGALALSLGVFLQVTSVEMAAIALTIGAVLAMELLNTAIESVVDLTVQQAYHELAKIAKDCAAGAVLISALAAMLVAGSILVPPLLAKISAISY